MTATHVREHEDMLALADGILRAAARRDAGQTGDLAQMRLAFARLVNKHCEEEGRTIREAVAHGRLPRTLVATFHRELVQWRADLAMCNSEWPLTRVIRDPQGFGSRFGAIVQALRDYIRREDQQILAMLDRPLTRKSIAA